MTKTAIVILSDPKSGTEESLGRLFNALFLAHALKEKKQDVSIIFQGAGARWVFEVVKPDHPAHALYNSVSDKVAGMSGGCADVFCGADAAAKCSVPVLRDNAIPGTKGVADLSAYVAGDTRLLTF